MGGCKVGFGVRGGYDGEGAAEGGFDVVIKVVAGGDVRNVFVYIRKMAVGKGRGGEERRWYLGGMG